MSVTDADHDRTDAQITVVAHDASDATVDAIRDELRATGLRGWEVVSDE